MWCNILLRTMDARGTLTLILISILFNSIHKIANSGAFFHTEATSDLISSHGHMQGQLSTTVTPEKDLSRVDLAARGLWGLGVESLSANCRVDFSLIGVVVPMCTIVTDQSRGDLLCIPMTPAPKTQNDCTLSSQILCTG